MTTTTAKPKTMNDMCSLVDMINAGFPKEPEPVYVGFACVTKKDVVIGYGRTVDEAEAACGQRGIEGYSVVSITQRTWDALVEGETWIAVSFFAPTVFPVVKVVE